MCMCVFLTPSIKVSRKRVIYLAKEPANQYKEVCGHTRWRDPAVDLNFKQLPFHGGPEREGCVSVQKSEQARGTSNTNCHISWLQTLSF